MSTLLTRVVIALTLLAVVPACGPVDPIEPPPPIPFKPSGDLAFEVGTGELVFQTVTTSTKVALQFGPQGGEHIWFAARCKGAGSPARVHYRITDPAGQLVSPEQRTVLPAEMDQDGWRFRAGLTAFVDGSVPLVNGEKLTFHGHLEDDYGTALDAIAEGMLTTSGQ